MTTAQGSSRVSAGTTCCVRQSFEAGVYFCLLPNADKVLPVLLVGQALAAVFGRLLFCFCLLHNRAKTIQ